MVVHRAGIACTLAALLSIMSMVASQSCTECWLRHAQAHDVQEQCQSRCMPKCPSKPLGNRCTPTREVVEQIEQESCNLFALHYRATLAPMIHVWYGNLYLQRCGRIFHTRGALRYYPGGPHTWQNSACYRKLGLYPRRLHEQLERAFFEEYGARLFRAAWQMEQHGSIRAVSQPLSRYSSTDCRHTEEDTLQ